MRTTVNIDGHLLAKAKAEAARAHRSVGDIIDDGLRVLFAERGQPAPAARTVVLPVGGGSGLQPGVDLEDKESLAEVLGDNDPFRAAG